MLFRSWNAFCTFTTALELLFPTLLLRLLPRKWVMSMVSDFTRTFPPRKSGTKTSAVPVCWLIIAGHLEETFHRQNIAEYDPLLLLGSVYALCNVMCIEASFKFQKRFTYKPFRIQTNNTQRFGKSLCTYKRWWKSIERTIVNKNRIKQVNTLPVLHFNRCITTEYSETTAQFSGSFDTDNQIYVP
jgi:hypothetical protein